jgi:hypothetical protein
MSRYHPLVEVGLVRQFPSSPGHSVKAVGKGKKIAKD